MFEKIAPYLKDPLILIGFFLFVSLLFLRLLVTKGIIPVLEKKDGFHILKIILLYGFIIGLLLIGLGFGLKYKEMSKGEQKNIVGLLSRELDANMSAINELKKNTETFLYQQITLSRSLRTPNIKILPIMFPEENLDLDKTVNANDMARNAIQKIGTAGLENNKLEMTKLEEFSKALTKTERSVISTDENLRDSGRTRYYVRDEVWKNNLEAYRKMTIIDMALFQRAYTQMQNIRNDYDIIAKAVIEFQRSLLDYFRIDNEITWDQLAMVLTIERHSYEMIVDYSKNIVNTLTDLIGIKKKLDQQQQ